MAATWKHPSHEHTPYRGEMPCTGPRVCTMCGAMEGTPEIQKECTKTNAIFWRG